MLETLQIRNLALVPHLEIDFGKGLNIVTGETGAGKSLVIGALQLLAGGRAAPSSIRKGEKSCEITGVFNICSKDFDASNGLIESRLEASGLPPCEEGRLLLKRIITENGSKAYVNGSMVTAGLLKEISENLIDMHGPHDNQTLLMTSRQLQMLDIYAGLSTETADLKAKYAELAETRRLLEELRNETLAPEEQNLLEYQLKEIESSHPAEIDEEELLSKYRLASNSRRLVELAAGAAEALSEGENNVADSLAVQLRSLHELAQLDPDGGCKLVEQLEEAAECIRDLGAQFADYAGSLDMDQEELQKLEKRMDRIQRLKHKYGPSLKDVIATAARIRAKLECVEGRAERIRELEEKEKSDESSYMQLCRAVSDKRRTAAPALASAIEGKLRALGFDKAAFSISLKDAAASASGMDAAEYNFAPNVGEDMLPLRSIASSGEIARVMLAIKTVLSDADGVPILVFDEIDANIGGRVAVAVADELKAVSGRHQVFCISHKPQIAASGARHYLVEKKVSEGRTSTDVKQIDGQDRLDEIVRMLGADMSSAAAVAHAKELLGENIK